MALRRNLLCLIVLIPLVVCNNPRVFAQDEFQKIQVKGDPDSYNLVPVGDQGILIFNKTEETNNNDQQIWNFKLLNTDFSEVWNDQYTISEDMEYIDYYYAKEEQKLYMYFSEYKTLFMFSSDLAEGAKGLFQIVELDLKRQVFNYTQGTNSTRTAISEFRVEDDVAFWGGRDAPNFGNFCGQCCFEMTLIPTIFGSTVYKFRPVLATTNLSNGRTEYKLKHEDYKGYHGKLSGLIRKTDGDFLASVPTIARNDSRLWLYEYDKDGDKEDKFNISPEGDKVMVNGKLQEIGGKKTLIGTFNYSTTKSFKSVRQHGPNFPVANGIYYTTLDNNSKESIDYFNISIEDERDESVSFSIFGGGDDEYESPENGKKLNMEVKKDEEFGEDESYWDGLRVVLHDLYEHNGQYILIGEAYEREYEVYTTTTTRTTANGNMVTTTDTRREFIGYRFNKGFCISFNKYGSIEWSEAFMMNSGVVDNLDTQIKVLQNEMDFKLIYPLGGKIIGNEVKKKSLSDGTKYGEVNFEGENQKVKEVFKEGMEYWYGENFISWAVKEVKDTDKGLFDANKKHTNLYFQKVSFD